MTRVPPVLAGLVVAALVAAACGLAWAEGSPVVPRDGGRAPSDRAYLFGLLLALAYVAYVAALALVRRGGSRACVLAIALVVQLAPLGAPLLLSTDAWTYWSYGWSAAHRTNPYTSPPSSRPDSPAAPFMGEAWTETPSVYGPIFTLASEPIARAAGDDETLAAWIYKALAAAAILTATLLAARLSRTPLLAAAFVGWNPVLAIHAGGGGHNDAWIGALVLAALALEGGRRTSRAGLVWALAILVKWVPVPLLALRLLAPTTPRRARLAAAVALSLGLLATVATARYGTDWLGVAAPLAENAVRETRFALPSRLEQAGVPAAVAAGTALAVFGAGVAWLVRSALRGHARLAAAACLLLVTTPYLAVWYLAWAVPLAAADDDDRGARLCCLALGAYLLPQTVPL